MCTWACVIGGLVAVLGVLAVWLGFFKTMEIQENVFPGGTFVYVNWRGALKNLKDPFHSVFDGLMAYRRTNAEAPTDADVSCMGVYYDDPKNLKNPTHFRVCAGFLILDSTPADQKKALIENMKQKGF